MTEVHWALCERGRAGTPAALLQVLRRHLGMSRFELGDGFHSTSAPA